MSRLGKIEIVREGIARTRFGDGKPQVVAAMLNRAGWDQVIKAGFKGFCHG